MVSRRKILSRSRDDLNLEDSNSFRPGAGAAAPEEEDVWYAKEKLYKVKKIYSFNFIRSFVLEKLLDTKVQKRECFFATLEMT